MIFWRGLLTLWYTYFLLTIFWVLLPSQVLLHLAHKSLLFWLVVLQHLLQQSWSCQCFPPKLLGALFLEPQPDEFFSILHRFCEEKEKQLLTVTTYVSVPVTIFMQIISPKMGLTNMLANLTILTILAIFMQITSWGTRVSPIWWILVKLVKAKSAWRKWRFWRNLVTCKHPRNPSGDSTKHVRLNWNGSKCRQSS